MMAGETALILETPLYQSGNFLPLGGELTWQVKSLFLMGDTFSKGPFSVAMFVY